MGLNHSLICISIIDLCYNIIILMYKLDLNNNKIKCFYIILYIKVSYKVFGFIGTQVPVLVYVKIIITALFNLKGPNKRTYSK